MPVSKLSSEAIIADDLANDLPIFLLYIALIVALARASSRKRDLFLFAVGRQFHVNKFSSIIRINPQEGKRQKLSCSLQCGDDYLLTAPQQGETFCPASGDIGQRQGEEVRSLSLGATMGHQISFHEARCAFLPVVKRANGDLLFEERSRSGGRDPVPLLFAIRLENPVCGRRTHREELSPTFFTRLEMSMSLQ